MSPAGSGGDSESGGNSGISESDIASRGRRGSSAGHPSRGEGIAYGGGGGNASVVNVAVLHRSICTITRSMTDTPSAETLRELRRLGLYANRILPTRTTSCISCNVRTQYKTSNITL